MNPLISSALFKADEIRQNLGLNIYQPINVLDACIELNVNVRFVDINMEGMFIKNDNVSVPTILVSTQRPFPRRFFTCAHELGHHVFGHGMKVDVMADKTNESYYDNDEFLVDSFAGALLMPIAGIQAEFAKRGWNPSNMNSEQFYTVSSIFGVGYRTLITHCKVNKIINDIQANSLSKLTPSRILDGIIGNVDNSFFKIIDSYSNLSTIDLEVSNYIFLPTDVVIEGDHIEMYKKTRLGNCYIAKKPGVVRASNSDNKKNYFIRIQNINYVGLAENRHLEIK